MNTENQTPLAPTVTPNRLPSSDLLGSVVWKADLRDALDDLYRIAAHARHEGSECGADYIEYAARSLHGFAEYSGLKPKSSDAPAPKTAEAFYRELLEQIAADPRRTRARRLAESGLIFWDAMREEVPSLPNAQSEPRP